MRRRFVVFEARWFLTMDPNRPTATHVAVSEGRILTVGDSQDVAGWGEHELDRRFADKMLMPGLVVIGTPDLNPAVLCEQVMLALVPEEPAIGLAEFARN